MNWWDTSGITNIASHALKNAQKKIDKVLDISDGSSNTRKGSQQTSKSASKDEEKGVEDGDFWSGWLGTGNKKSNEDKHSSWSLPWSGTSSTSEHDAGHTQASSSTSATVKPKSTSEHDASHTLSAEASSSTSATVKPKVSVRSDIDLPKSSLDQESLEESSRPQKIETKQTAHQDSFVAKQGVGTDTVERHLDQQTVSDTDTFTTNWQYFPIDDCLSETNVSDSRTKDISLLQKTSGTLSAMEDMAIVSNLNVNTAKENYCAIQAVKENEDVTDIKDSELLPKQPVTPRLPDNYTDIDLVENRLSPVKLLDFEPTQIDPPTSAENTFPVDETTSFLNAQYDDSLLKNSASSSFTALSDDFVPELLSSSSPPTLHNEGSSSEGGFETEINQYSDNQTFSSKVEASMSISSDASFLDISKSSDEENNVVSQNLGKHEIGSDDVQCCISGSLLESAYQQLQPELMQDYVNVSSVNTGGHSGPTEASTGSSDELHFSSEIDMGTSRTSSDLDLLGGRTSSTGSSDTSKFDSSIDTVVDRSVIDSQSDADVTEKEPPYSLFGDSNLDERDLGADGGSKIDLISDDSESMSSSYVKNMIQEAMEDLSKTEDSGSDNHSSGEKSESSKVDSELEKSIYSGHESSDEIETTTSSDIEILSAPTPNGDNKYNAAYDFSPIKIALTRSGRDQGHNQSDSLSSSSAHSKAGEGESLSPERGEGATWREESYFHHHDLHAVREEETDNPYHPERLLKLAELVVKQHLQGGQKLAEMAEVLQARENKLVQLSKDNHQLTEDNTILRNQLKQSEEAREAETADLTALTQEFTVRIGEQEKKLQGVLKEKEALKQKLTSAEKELERWTASSDVEALLEEKREQVEDLLREGEKLSKQQLQNSTIIKKLRAKEKENDVTITSQKKKIDELTKEMERLTVVLDSKEEMEKKQAEAISQLNAAVVRQEKDISKLKNDLEDALEKSRGLQVALDNSYKEIAELHRSNASQDSKAQEAALSAETLVREELKSAMDREQQRFRQEREAFIMQVDDLRLDMARLEKEHSRREDLLRQEIAHLQERLQQDEARSQDLTQTVTSATRPLLRQIENLQATFGAQSAAWERVEKSLTDRLAEAQTALAMAQEKERTANDRHMELLVKVTTLEAANTRLKQEKSELSSQVESDKSRLEELQDARNSIVAQLESSKQKLTQELTQLKMEKVHLESQLSIERTKLENEKKKTQALEEQLRVTVERPRSRGTPSPSPSMSISRQESIAGSLHDHNSSGGMGWSFHEDGESSSTFPGSRPSVYESLRQSGAAIIVENLSSQLKLREGEIIHMQSEIGQLERTRESMARELVNLTNQNEELHEMKQAHEHLQEEFSELNNRYSAILQMYGEKEERVQELQLDLQDVKEMYKTQIDALLAK